MAAKIQINSKTYCTFGGIFYVQVVFNRTLSDVIDNFLGPRGTTPHAYRYSELMSALFCKCLCGGDVLEDLNMRFRSEIGRPDGRVARRRMPPLPAAALGRKPASTMNCAKWTAPPLFLTISVKTGISALWYSVQRSLSN